MALLAACCAGRTRLAADTRDGTNPRTFADRTIEELMNEPVTSVEKRESSLWRSPAAIAVVTDDDIDRLGFTTLAETLRFVPGMEVARVTANQWAVSARGFNAPLANKLLVLMDGRSIYSPSFGGVFWGLKDTVMQDIERIEIIRGPGATLWGANAMNGVINITTKNARETQGTLIATDVGTEDRPSVTIRHGGRLADTTYYRAYVKYFDRDHLVSASGRPMSDDWDSVRGGVRIDAEPTADQAVMFDASAYHTQLASVAQTTQLTPPFVTYVNEVDCNHGGFAIGRWTRQFAPDAQLVVQAYYDHAVDILGGVKDRRDVGDIEVQHQFTTADTHHIVWGAGLRRYSINTRSTTQFIVTPESRTTDLTTAFVQDQITLAPARVSLVLGAKLEYMSQTGLEAQPGVRVLWTPTEKQTWWASATRAMRTASRMDTDVRINALVIQPDPAKPPLLIARSGNPQAKPEVLDAFELGYRVNPTERLSVDVSTFYHDYHDLVRYASTAPTFEATPTPPHLLSNSILGNDERAETFGVEISALWQASPKWRLAADVSWLHARFRFDPPPSLARNSPGTQVHLRSYFDLSSSWQINAALGYVGSITDTSRNWRIPAYVRCDIGLRWHAQRSLELGLWGRNLFDPQHSEFSGIGSPAELTEVPREISARVTWRF